MLNKELVQKKVNSLDGYIREVQPLLLYRTAEIVADRVKLRAVERNFQLIVRIFFDRGSYPAYTQDK